MNRPPKKHKPKKDGILEDPRFSREELEAADRKLHHDQAPKGDDRNLVHVDDAFKEADFEDQAWLFWNKNKHFIIGLFVLVLLGFAGVEGYKLYRESAIASMQQEYSAADSTEAKITFGEANSSMPLGGFALLEAADATYTDGDYSEAASLYKEAATGLQGTYFYGRALIGEAMSQVLAGQTDAGTSLLKSISVNGDLLDAIRAQAIYNLGAIATSQGNHEEARRYLEQAVKLQPEGPWGSLAKDLMNDLPASVAAASVQAPVPVVPAALEPTPQDASTETEAPSPAAALDADDAE